jgi:uncharacterized protein (TIGR03435 family)
LRVMFQNLLADRFKLTFHWVTKELPTYSILVYKDGPKMRESTDLPSLSSNAPPPRVEGPLKLDTDGFPIYAGPQRDGVALIKINGRSRLRGQRATMKDLANELSRTQLKFPVTDETGLKAKYDFTVMFASPGWNRVLEDIPELGISASAYASLEPLSELGAALQSQLGLKLEQKPMPAEVFVVDHVEKAPTAN